MVENKLNLKNKLLRLRPVKLSWIKLLNNLRSNMIKDMIYSANGKRSQKLLQEEMMTLIGLEMNLQILWIRLTKTNKF